MIRKTRAFKLAILALFIAFILIQNFVPLFGYIPIGPLSLTTIHITVIIAAIVLGPLPGGILGGVWGLLSLIRAFAAPTSPVEPLIFTNPLIAILPRILIAIVAAYLFIFLTKIRVKKAFAMMLAGLAGALTNTVLVLGMIYLFYRTPEVASAYGVANPSLIGGLLLTVIGTNGIPEAILAAIVTPVIALPLYQYVHKAD
ncbi:MAG: ECF transporter S component [Oenococcus sp.]|uniref:ECF transporter S component n=1 Tax=Oenococcus TaxID=46254 RepID=UPI0021E79BB7|nr:ECF transporter S component [Oenococcus kitaharae]MCV3295650.1 ECF transporter S component [Oenococcus kitaharae]